MDGFAEHTRAWFDSNFPSPTAAQLRTWPPLLAGENVLLSAPTGSGKTLAAFLSFIDRIGAIPPDERRGTSVVYVSPLRALAVDVEKNLRSPIVGIGHAAARLGRTFVAPTVGVRTGDTSASDRRQLIRRPPDILVTTPESLYLMLTSAARETLTEVTAVILDEIHALVPTKRGAHLSLSLERLERLRSGTTGGLQRVGLSATQRPLAEVARFLGGFEAVGARHREQHPGDDPPRPVARPVTIVDEPGEKSFDLGVVVPAAVEAGGEAVNPSVWPEIHASLLALIESHRSTLIFVNDRRSAERLAAKLNELHAQRVESATVQLVEGPPPPVDDLVMAHHGSISKERRAHIEDALKRGRLRGLVATSSLELGIDMGAVDLVVQVGAPPSVAAGLQRIGRAGHQVGAVSTGRLFPKFPADILESATITERMLVGAIEQTRIVRQPLDVLAQQIVAIVAVDDVDRLGVLELVRCSANYVELADSVFTSVVEMLAGRYPSEEFTELRARIDWDRTTDVLTARRGSQRLAVTNAGTIPDRGLFGVFLPDGTRVGELDEELVYESRAGDTIMLGASTWAIEEIGFDRVVVTPAPGRPGRLPFWRGDAAGRPVELGTAVGRLTRELRATGRQAARTRLTEGCRLEPSAADALLEFLDDQQQHSGAVPDDRTVVVERFRDEIGDWRVCILTPFGNRVHAPWGQLLRRRLIERWPVPDLGDRAGVEVLWSESGIVVRLPENVDRLDLEDLWFDPATLRDELISAVSSSALFASRFRESAGRSLLLPRRRPGQRSPLWQQRQRSADLLAVASKYPQFPMLLEATRECLEDYFDVEALRSLMAAVEARSTRLVSVETAGASPFSRSLLFDWIAVFMYAGDTPLAERRAAALSLDRGLLAELLGSEELRSLLDESVIAEVHAWHQRQVPRRRARDAEGIVDLLRALGPLELAELGARCETAELTSVLDGLILTRRVIDWHDLDRSRWFAAVEDAGRVRDCFGVALEPGLPAEFTEPVADPNRDLVLRLALSSGPFDLTYLRSRLPIPAALARRKLDELAGEGVLLAGEFRPSGLDDEWCAPRILSEIKRKSLAAARAEIEPVPSGCLAEFLVHYQGLGSRAARGRVALEDVILQLEGTALTASALERDILPARLVDYTPAMLDSLFADGELVWVGAGALGVRDGRVRLVFRENLDSMLAVYRPQLSSADGPLGELQHRLLQVLGGAEGSASVALRWHDLRSAISRSDSGLGDASGGESPMDHPPDSDELRAALWNLAWSGLITNDSFGPVRAAIAAAKGSGSAPRGGAHRPGRSSRMRRRERPETSGRWWALRPREGAPADGASGAMGPASLDTKALIAQCERLLDLYGILARELVAMAGVPGGFAALYPVLRTMEERGSLRRGYFVEGLGAAQFAREGVADQLRNLAAEQTRAVERIELGTLGGEPARPAEVTILEVTDPGCVWGAVIPWPEPSELAAAEGFKPQRAAGRLLVSEGSAPVAFLDRRGRSWWTFADDGTFATPEVERWIRAVADYILARERRIEVRSIDGLSVAAHPLADRLAEVGFATSYRGMSITRTSR